jgi:predicted nucleotidyltransferase
MGIQVTEIFLYGSHARGEATEGSDIDLIVVSPDFNKYCLRERLELLGVAAARIFEPVQAYGFTPGEIQEQRVDTFWGEILKKKSILSP